MTGNENYNFQEVLKDNRFAVNIRAKVSKTQKKMKAKAYCHNLQLTIRSSRDLLAPTKFFEDVFNPDLADFTIQIGRDTWKAHKFILSGKEIRFALT